MQSQTPQSQPEQSQTGQSQTGQSQSTEKSRGRDTMSGIFWGVVMILVGFAVLGSQLFDLDSLWGQFGSYIPLILGIAFLAWGIVQREAGFLIPGGILSGIGVGIFLTAGPGQGDMGDPGGLFLISMALGFMSITALTAIFTREVHWWALIPGGIIGLVGLTTMYGGIFELALQALSWLWPVALIVGGAYTIYRVSRRSTA